MVERSVIYEQLTSQEVQMLDGYYVSSQEQAIMKELWRQAPIGIPEIDLREIMAYRSKVNSNSCNQIFWPVSRQAEAKQRFKIRINSIEETGNSEEANYASLIKNLKNMSFDDSKNLKTQINDQSNLFKIKSKRQERGEIQNQKQTIAKIANQKWKKQRSRKNRNKIPQIKRQQIKLPHHNIHFPEFSQRFCYKNVIVSVDFGNYDQYGYKSILVVPFQNLQFGSFPSKNVCKCLTYDAKNQLESVLACRGADQFIEGETIILGGDGLKNFSQVYFLKIPKYKAENYLINRLQQSISQMFRIINCYGHKEIVIPRFDWDGLALAKKASKLLESIFQELNHSRKSQLKQICLCLDHKEEYLAFARELRRLSDDYMISMP